jgi:hypothetical protein
MPKSVQLFPPDESNFLRHAYFEAFANTTSEHYQKYVAPLQQFSDGKHYTGYLWDNIRDGRRVTFERLRNEISLHPKVNVMADNHSRDRVINAPLWPYPTNSVIALPPTLLIQLLHALPDDLYIFDLTLTWTLIMTHEHDTKRRICIAAGEVAKA